MKYGYDEIVSPLLTDPETNLRLARIWNSGIAASGDAKPNLFEGVHMAVDVGDFVLYTLNVDDVHMIEAARADLPGNNYNPVIEGGVYPALLLAAHGSAFNLKVFLDGQDTYWIPMRQKTVDPPRPGYFHERSGWSKFSTR